MSYPSDYQPTLKTPIPFYQNRVDGGDESIHAFFVEAGLSYVGPLMGLPPIFRTFDGITSFAWGMTQYPEIQNKANILSKFPKGLRGARPVFSEQYDVFFFANEALPDSTITNLRTLRGLTYVSKNDETRMDLSAVRVTGYYGTPWPVEGITVMSEFMTSYIRELAKLGATMDAFITDIEYIHFGDYTYPERIAAFTGSTQYYQPYQGLSSWNDLLASYGASASQLSTSPNQAYLGTDANWAWAKVACEYVGHVFNLGYYKNAESINPKLVSANYNSYTGEKIREDEALNEDGRIWPQGGNHGNGGSPLLYAVMRQFQGNEQTRGNCIKEEDSTRLWNFNAERSVYGRRGPLVIRSASGSFMLAMMELRTAKRNAYYSPVIPHIASVFTNQFFDGQGYDFLGYRVFTPGFNQSPPEVLHDSWYPQNISGYIYNVGGITSYDGTTSAYLIRPSLSLISETWYKQNIDSLTFDGATTAYQIKTSGICGTTSALAYYLNGGLTSGNTYVFSYFVDASRGFTGFNGRFTTWDTSDSIGLAPSLTSTSGITFQQILPVTGPISYLQTPIQYNPGDSGWVKVAFEFVYSSSTPRLALHTYHATNQTTQGYTAFIKDVYLNHKLNGQTKALSFIENKNRNSSVEYYYKGITSGLTYIFSYYVDTTRSYTGSNSIQTFNHFQKPTYNLPLGITFNQILPVNINGSFNTAGISYGSGNTWTKISYSFNVPIGDTYDPIFRETFAASICRFNTSVMDSDDVLKGICFYIASPTLEIESSPSNISIPVAPVDYETLRYWHKGPPMGLCDIAVGPNRRYNMYLTERPGNSAYFTEMLYHCGLNGCAKIAMFNLVDYVNFGLTGSIRDGDGSNLYGPKKLIYANSGLTQHIESMQVVDKAMREVHNRIGGYTTASADVSRPDWLAPYFASGAPDTTGTTWWWRITSMPGYTVYCNEITLNSNNTVGTWVGTTGPTLAGVNISYTKWTQLKPEPSISSPTKEFNFAGMTSISNLIDAGFTFTRGSTATYTDSTGKIVVVGPNVPRFANDPKTLEPLGLLLEPSQTNLLNWSESFASTGGAQNNWIDTNLSRTTGFTSPSRTTNAIRFTATTANATLISSSPIGSSTTRSFSIFIRGVTSTEKIYYTLDGGTTWIPIEGENQYSNAAGDNITHTIKPIGPKLSTTWQRFMYGPTAFGDIKNHHVGIKFGNTGDAVEIWGAQVQVSTFATILTTPASSYIPTGSSTVTKSADSCLMTGSSFNSWYGQTYGTFVVTAKNIFSSRIIDLNKDSGNYMNFRAVQNLALEKGVRGQTNIDFVKPLLVTGYPVPEVEYKFVFTYGPKGVKYCSYLLYDEGYNSIQSYNWPGNTLGPPEITNLTFTSGFNVSIKNVRYWPYVFDETTMKDMAQGGVDPSVGLFGAYG